MIKAETDRDESRKETNTAREESANLRGRIEILQTQVAEFMRVLSVRPASEGENPPKSATAVKVVRGKKSE